MKSWIYIVLAAIAVWLFLRKSRGAAADRLQNTDPLVFTWGGFVPASKAKGSWGGYDSEGQMRNAPRTETSSWTPPILGP